MHPFCCVSPTPEMPAHAHPTPPPLPSPSRAPHAPHINGHDLPPTQQRQLSALDHREVKINDIVGKGICGVLHKWVNYGKGWRPRWFVLQDGVLSYYKIHGPHKITLSLESEKGCKVIGDDSMRRIHRRQNHHNITAPSNSNNSTSNSSNFTSGSNNSTTTSNNNNFNRKPFGEIHLKVSSIRESRSDDKRFSIFTGTKRLHLRAETREDRAAWMDALQAVKDMFPRMSNSELMAPIDNVVVSTEKLRQRLQEEGLNEGAIQDSEQIMRSEFSTLQNQLVLLKQKHWMLIDTLRQLEVHVKKTKRKHATRFQHSISVSPSGEY